MVMPELAAVLLDFDGTLADTEPIWIESEMAAMAKIGVPWSFEQARQLTGSTAEATKATLSAQMELYGVTPPMDQFYSDMAHQVTDHIKADGVNWLPGARELLVDLGAHQMPCALVSVSPPHLVNAALAQFPADVITVAINGRMVKQGKPDPEGYCLAASRLGVDPTNCIIIEDSFVGTQAGLSAGAVVIAVPGLVELDDQPGMIKLPGLKGVDLARLREIFRQARSQDDY